MTFNELQENFYEDLNGRINVVRWEGDTFHYDFEFDHWSDDRRISATISCRGVLESTVSVGCLGGLHEAENHPLLWHHCEPYDTLFFSSPASNPFELLGRLYGVHHRMFHAHRDPRDYFQTDPEVLKRRVGELASGPRSAIAAYYEVAASYMRCNVVTGPDRTADLHLLWFDSDYLICRDFTFTDTTGRV